jgi:hypothetical protein
MVKYASEDIKAKTMFKKIVSNLPFNPGLINQVSFYAKRLHKEETVRRVGFAFLAAAFMVNVFAVASPAKRTLASGPNDMIWGATNKDIVSYALAAGSDGHNTDIKEIYGLFGITEQDVTSACKVNLVPSDDLQTYNTTYVEPSCADSRIGAFTGSLITSGRYPTALAGNPHYENIKSAEDQAGRSRNRNKFSLPSPSGMGRVVYRSAGH